MYARRREFISFMTKGVNVQASRKRSSYEFFFLRRDNVKYVCFACVGWIQTGVEMRD